MKVVFGMQSDPWMCNLPKPTWPSLSLSLFNYCDNKKHMWYCVSDIYYVSDPGTCSYTKLLHVLTFSFGKDTFCVHLTCDFDYIGHTAESNWSLKGRFLGLYMQSSLRGVIVNDSKLCQTSWASVDARLRNTRLIFMGVEKHMHNFFIFMAFFSNFE